MGIVVRAHDRTLEETVAIKILRTEYAGERVWSERLAREVKLARQIQHPNVCRMFDFEQADGRVFLVMELAEAGSLREEIAAGQSGTVRSRAARRRRAMAAGLASIHDAGIVHRDISPQNMLRMADGRLVLSDFGLATDPSESTTSLRGGTIAYMAPEILRGSGADGGLGRLGTGRRDLRGGVRRQAGGGEPRAASCSRRRCGGRSRAEERAVLEICRAATASGPRGRPDGAEVSPVSPLKRWAALAAPSGGAGRRRFSRRGGGRVGGGHRAVPPVARRGHACRRQAPVPADEIEGQPEDWTNKSRVIGEIPDRVRCVVPLPDRRTVRIVWGSPRMLRTSTPDRATRSVSPVSRRVCRGLSGPVARRQAARLSRDTSPTGVPSSFCRITPRGARPSRSCHPWSQRWLGAALACRTATLSYDVDLEHGVFAVDRVARRSSGPPDLHGAVFHVSVDHGGSACSSATSPRGPRRQFIGFDGDSSDETASAFAFRGFVSRCLRDGRTLLGVTSGTDESEAFSRSDPTGSRTRRVGIIGEQPFDCSNRSRTACSSPADVKGRW